MNPDETESPTTFIHLVIIIECRSVSAADAPVANGVAVVAQGVSTMPAHGLVWRLIRDTALNGAQAPVLEPALGFAVTEQGPIVIEDSGTGALIQIGPGGAAVVPEGGRQRHVGSGEGPSSYVRIGLVDPAEAEYTAGSDRLAVSEVFAAPGGARDIELSFAGLADGDDVTVAITAGPVAVVVLDGAVDVAGTAVAAGEAAALDTGGKLTVTATTDDTRVYIAAIGPEILLGSELEVVRTGSGDAGSAPEIVPDANPNPSDTAGSGGVAPVQNPGNVLADGEYYACFSFYQPA